MFDGSSGSRWMPRKMAGREMMTIDWLIPAMNTPSVVLERTIQRFRSTALAWAAVAAGDRCPPGCGTGRDSDSP